MSNYYDVAQSSYSSGDFTTCLGALSQGVSEGSEDCMTLLGTLYLDGGAGLEKNIPAGLKLIEAAVNNFNPRATLVFGQIFYYGMGDVKKDTKKGLQYIRRAAFMRYTEAQWVLCYAYSKKWSKTQSMTWGLVAANNGHPEAIKWVNGLKSAVPQKVKTFAEKLLNCIDRLYILKDIDWKETKEILFYYEANEKEVD